MKVNNRDNEVVWLQGTFRFILNELEERDGRRNLGNDNQGGGQSSIFKKFVKRSEFDNFVLLKER